MKAFSGIRKALGSLVEKFPSEAPVTPQPVLVTGCPASVQYWERRFYCDLGKAHNGAEHHVVLPYEHDPYFKDYRWVSLVP